MNASHTQIRTHRYTSGWCEAAWHDRCKGSYAGTACHCSCHRQAVPERSAEGTRGAFPRPGHDVMPWMPVASGAGHLAGAGAPGSQVPTKP